MSTVKIFINKNIQIGEVSPNIFSSFVEHMGRCVYTGIYEPEHPSADEEGFRQDVLDLVKGLDISYVRYPGGNFLSGYDWKDGIGKKENRPVRPDLAWRATETNQFGTDEFMNWCRKAGVNPMMAVNLGTGTPQNAAQLVEYCNLEGGTYYSDMRRENGRLKPHGVDLWCLGNEMDGPWQICHMNAEDYGKKAMSAAKMMRYVDPSIKLVACGSSYPGIETFPEWDRKILEVLYDDVEYISVHDYYWPNDGMDNFYASYQRMDNYIKTVKATIEYVRAKRRSSKRLAISFDEWNVWYQNRQWESDWKTAPRQLEDIYSQKDAVVFAGLINTLINNCDSVKAACFAQLVNVIAPIFTEPAGTAIKQATYYPFELASRYGRGTALNVHIESPKFDSKHGAADFVSSAVVLDEERRELTAFLACYNNEALNLELELNGFGYVQPVEAFIMTNNDIEAVNTIENPETVFPVHGELPVIKNGAAHYKLEPMSYTVLRFAI